MLRRDFSATRTESCPLRRKDESDRLPGEPVRLADRCRDVSSGVSRASSPAGDEDRDVRRSELRELAPDRADSGLAAEVAQLMRAFYAVISFPEGGCPDWEAMASLFSEHARITRVTPEGIDHLDFTSFRNLAEELIEVGAFTSFFEREIARRVDCFGGVLHVASAYETKVSPRARDYIERGVNSLQFIREQNAWRIVSLCWDANPACSQSCLQPAFTDEVLLGQS
jgi:hypothetical protein